MDPVTLSLLMAAMGAGAQGGQGFMSRQSGKKTEANQKKQLKDMRAAFEAMARREYQKNADMNALSTQTTAALLKDLRGSAGRGESALRESGRRAGAKIRQNLTARGLSGSTIQNNADAGIARGTEESVNQYKDSVGAQRRAIRQGGTNQLLGIMGNRPNFGPSLSDIYGLQGQLSVVPPPWYSGVMGQLGGGAMGLGAYGIGANVLTPKEGGGGGKDVKTASTAPTTKTISKGMVAPATKPKAGGGGGTSARVSTSLGPGPNGPAISSSSASSGGGFSGVPFGAMPSGQQGGDPFTEMYRGGKGLWDWYRNAKWNPLLGGKHDPMLGPFINKNNQFRKWARSIF